MVLTYLQDQSVSPLPFRRLAERDPARASEVFQRVLKQPGFSWERDGDALLRQHKAEFFARPVLPSTVPLAEEQSRRQMAAPERIAPKPNFRPARRGEGQTESEPVLMAHEGMVPFVHFFPQQGVAETRTLIIRGDSTVPDGEYGLLELYCVEPGCDCRRVLISVIRPAATEECWPRSATPLTATMSGLVPFWIRSTRKAGTPIPSCIW